MIAAARRRRGLLPALIVCGGLTIAIVAPLLHSGTLLLLDYGTYPAGPNPQLDASVWGFPPGLVTRAPVDVVLYALFRALDWEWLRLLPFFIFAPLAWVGFRRLLGPRTLAVAAATVLFVVNPWTDDRMSAGQVYLIVGYALLPLLTSMLFVRKVRPFTHLVLTGLLIALLIALAPHFIFIAGVLVAVALVVHVASREWQRAKEIGGALVTAGAISVYWLIPALLFHPESLPVTNADLSAFATTSDARYGLGLNVLGLYGFWRPGNPLAKTAVSGWPFLLLAILVLVGVGGWFAWTRMRARSLVITLGITAVIAYFLALGNQGPTGGLFTLLYDHVPGFGIMREPEKFSALLALGYATFFGLGVSCLAGLAKRVVRRRFVIGLTMAIPCVYGFTAFWGFGGYATPIGVSRIVGSGEQHHGERRPGGAHAAVASLSRLSVDARAHRGQSDGLVLPPPGHFGRQHRGRRHRDRVERSRGLTTSTICSPSAPTPPTSAGCLHRSVSTTYCSRRPTTGRTTTFLTRSPTSAWSRTGAT